MVSVIANAVIIIALVPSKTEMSQENNFQYSVGTGVYHLGVGRFQKVDNVVFGRVRQVEQNQVGGGVVLILDG